MAYPLLSDWNGEATAAFGVEHTYRGMDAVPIRSAFLIEDGVVRCAWRYADDEVPDVDELLAAVTAAA